MSVMFLAEHACAVWLAIFLACHGLRPSLVAYVHSKCFAPALSGLPSSALPNSSLLWQAPRLVGDYSDLDRVLMIVASSIELVWLLFSWATVAAARHGASCAASAHRMRASKSAFGDSVLFSTCLWVPAACLVHHDLLADPTGQPLRASFILTTSSKHASSSACAWLRSGRRYGHADVTRNPCLLPAEVQRAASATSTDLDELQMPCQIT